MGDMSQYKCVTYLTLYSYMWHVPLSIRICALCTPEERLPSGAPKEEFGRMIFEKKSSPGDRTKFQSTTSAGGRGCAGTCEAPCRLGRVWAALLCNLEWGWAAVMVSSARGVTLYLHFFSTSPPRAAAAELQYGPPGKIFFEKSSGQILPLGPWGKPLLRGTQRAGLNLNVLAKKIDFNVSYSSCWGYSLINTLKLKKIKIDLSQSKPRLFVLSLFLRLRVKNWNWNWN